MKYLQLIKLEDLDETISSYGIVFKQGNGNIVVNTEPFYDINKKETRIAKIKMTIEELETIRYKFIGLTDANILDTSDIIGKEATELYIAYKKNLIKRFNTDVSKFKL